ncbi:MAG: HD domain-containing protein [Sphaerochaetaceae bacterium]|nr:HD domain-containing protein [Sphaerochaetaceae bacterium]
MSEEKIFTAEQLYCFAKAKLSGKRFIHSVGVAQTAEMLLNRYRCENYVKNWELFTAGAFCGLAHDLGREMSDGDIVLFCKNHGLELSGEQIQAPVIAHGTVSAYMAGEICGFYPESWAKAIRVHTTGCEGMDDLALALFIADYIEPSRTFLDDTARQLYLDSPSIEDCAYRVLCDMIEHWEKKGYHKAGTDTLAMKEDIEKRLGR